MIQLSLVLSVHNNGVIQPTVHQVYVNISIRIYLHDGMIRADCGQQIRKQFCYFGIPTQILKQYCGRADKIRMLHRRSK
jgi:hypothetical protein